MHLSPVAALAVFVAGILLGALCWRWIAGSANASSSSHRIPAEWPLNPRPLVNSNERRVWVWLTKVMFDQQIMVKIPVTRFTTPAQLQEAEHWFKLLNGVYCTFTICDLNGHVIGCADVAGRKGLTIANQTLKHSLLSQCGVPYWVIDPENLPHLTQIRSAFLGEHAGHGTAPSALHEKLKDVAVNLHAAVSKQRNQKSSATGGAESGVDAAVGASIPTHWEDNSFLAPLDSRAGELRQ
jgi:hypothetical protein